MSVTVGGLEGRAGPADDDPAGLAHVGRPAGLGAMSVVFQNVNKVEELEL